jgi:hypothetical protein
LLYPTPLHLFPGLRCGGDGRKEHFGRTSPRWYLDRDVGVPAYHPLKVRSLHHSLWDLDPHFPLLPALADSFACPSPVARRPCSTPHLLSAPRLIASRLTCCLTCRPRLVCCQCSVLLVQSTSHSASSLTAPLTAPA